MDHMEGIKKSFFEFDVFIFWDCGIRREKTDFDFYIFFVQKIEKYNILFTIVYNIQNNVVPVLHSEKWCLCI